MKALRLRGARVVCAPVIKVAPADSYERLDAAIRKLDTFDLLIFTSVNAVDYFFRRLRALRFRPLSRPRLYAIGEATAAALASSGWPATAAGFADAATLARKIPLRLGERVLVPRALKARPELPKILRARGAVVVTATAYKTVRERITASTRRLLDGSAVDAVTFSSPSAVESLRAQLGSGTFRRLFTRAKALSIGPTTSSALKAAGVAPRPL